MKTTLEIPDDLFRRSKAMAALRGQSLDGFVTEALVAHTADSANGDWRNVFGKADPEQVWRVQELVEE